MVARAAGDVLLLILEVVMGQDPSNQSPGARGAGLELAGAAERAAGHSVHLDRRAAPVWWRPALAAAAVVILLESVLLAWLLARPVDPIGGAGPGVVLEVTFAPDATEGAIRDALLSVDGRIVEGPSPIGVYVVRVPLPGDDPAQVEAAMERLAARSGVVTYVTRD